MESKWHDLIKELKQRRGSDLHLSEGFPPTMRDNDGEIIFYVDTPLIGNEAEKIIREILSPEQEEMLKDKGEIDTAYSDADIRVRLNIFKDYNGYSFAFRLIRDDIPTMKEILLPLSVQELIKAPHGLIIVSGATGSGKTTTIASMLNAINETAAKHIITVEDPIEYIHTNKKSFFSQREVGQHTESFISGLRSALRQDPDVLFVGEIRDYATMSTALNAAETGHLVFSTLHTGNVVEAVDRIIQYFPTEEEEFAKSSLANCFLGIIHQELLPKRLGGKVAAFEVLLKTVATTNVIRSGRNHQLYDYMRGRDGMQTINEAKENLRLRGFIE